jgi:hypothetical protein
MRVIDIADIANENITEIGYFDTVPGSDQVGTSGLWNVYPFFPSGNIILSGNSGFTLVKDSETLSINDISSADIQSIYPNPASTHINVESSGTPLGDVRIFNILGQQVIYIATQQNKLKLNTSNLPAGVYFVQSTVATQRIIIQ